MKPHLITHCDPASITTEREAHLLELLSFLEIYTRELFGSGVHSSRVIRNARRIAEAYGAELTLYSSLRAEILSLKDVESGIVRTRVVPVPDLPVNFELNSDLSALSWRALDKRLPLGVVMAEFECLRKKQNIHFLKVLTLLSLANGAFCHLFGGDWIAIMFVVFSTACGFYLKRFLTQHHFNVFLAVVICAFLSSMIASASVMFDCTCQVAIATSPLYLVPGVPLINGVIDTVEGHVVTGVSRLVKAMLLICCMAMGLAGTLLIFQNSLL